MNSGFISVVIPSFNAEGTLRRALDSVLRQTKAPDEIIVVDDGSTDATESIVREYRTRVRYHAQSNQGASAARNTGVSETTGEWLAFLDADDEWLPTKLERQSALLDRSQPLAWCACNVEEVRDSRSYAGIIPAAARHELNRGGEHAPFFVLAAHGVLFATGALIVRRSALIAAGPFDVTLRTGEDRDMWWRIAMSHPNIGYIRQIGFRRYRGLLGSLTRESLDRSAAVRTVRDAARRARAVGDVGWRHFAPYGRLLAVDYVIRDATREISIEPTLLAELKSIFPLTPAERMFVAVLRSMPSALAQRVAHRRRPTALNERFAAAVDD